MSGVVLRPVDTSAVADEMEPAGGVDAELVGRAEGVQVVLRPGEWDPHSPGTDSGRLDGFPWSRGLDHVEHAIGRIHGTP